MWLFHDLNSWCSFNIPVFVIVIRRDSLFQNFKATSHKPRPGAMLNLHYCIHGYNCLSLHTQVIGDHWVPDTVLLLEGHCPLQHRQLAVELAKRLVWFLQKYYERTVHQSTADSTLCGFALCFLVCWLPCLTVLLSSVRLYRYMEDGAETPVNTASMVCHDSGSAGWHLPASKRHRPGRRARCQRRRGSGISNISHGMQSWCTCHLSLACSCWPLIKMATGKVRVCFR